MGGNNLSNNYILLLVKKLAKHANCDVLCLSVIWHNYMCLMSIIYDWVNVHKIFHLWWLPNVWFEKCKIIEVKGNKFK